MGWVYFIRYDDQVKIGLSDQPMHRFSHIQRQCPVRLDFLGAMPGNRALEKSLHQKWAEQNLRYDWFAADPALIDFIAQNTVPPPECRPRRRVTKRARDPENWITVRGSDPYNRVDASNAPAEARSL